MEKEVAREPLNFENDRKGERVTLLDNHRPRETFLESDWLPGNLCHIVADYVSDDKENDTRCALLGEQRITLCLSQSANFELGSIWHFGCLSLEDRLETSMKGTVDVQYLIKSYQSWINLLRGANSHYYSIVIEVLVIRLDLSSDDLLTVLDDLFCVLALLEKHLSSVQYVVFTVEKHAFLCFSLKDVMKNATGRRQALARQAALIQMVVDLQACCETNPMPNTMSLLDHYILQDDKPKSDKYLSKFIISLSHCRNRNVFDAVDPALNSIKLKWIYSLETVDEVKNFDQRIACRCHAVHLDASKISSWYETMEDLPPSDCLVDSPFVERIVMNTGLYGHVMKLPQPSPSLTVATPFSALVELTLNGNQNALDLTQLNNGLFPNLTYLSVIGGSISGHLDSQNVPCMKTLLFDLRPQYSAGVTKVDSFLREHTQAIIDTDRPWQLVATQEPGGWSLASYDEPTANPQNEVKDEAVQSRPFIRELMLVVKREEHASEWQSRLNGHPPLKAAVGDHSDRLLVWGLDRVEKIIAFGSEEEEIHLEFKEEIPGKTRIVTSLVFYIINSAVDGATLPHLESLEVNFARVTMSGAFLRLKTLSFQPAFLGSPWELNAPLLESFDCTESVMGNLSLRLQLLPRLSYLRIGMMGDKAKDCPTIVFDESCLGLLQLEHVVLEEGIAMLPFFHQCQVHNVSNLELVVDAYDLPACWFNTEWLCETLTITVFGIPPAFSPLSKEWRTLVLPPLPRLKKLKVAESNYCTMMLDSEMPNLTDCTVPSPKSLGQKLFCPALRCIRFTDKLPARDKEKCLNRATYEAIGAQPKWVYFKDCEKTETMSWNITPNATGLLALAGPLEDGGNSSVSREELSSSSSSSTSSEPNRGSLA